MTYALFVIGNLLITLIAVVLAPVLPLFAIQRMWWCDNHSYVDVAPVLPSWLNWFNTPDNSLDGDATFQKINGLGYFSKVKWLWRNPAYSFGLRYLHSPYKVVVKGDISIKDNDQAKVGWCYVTANGLFQFRWVFPIGFSRCIYCNFGHNIFALADPNVEPKPDPYQATFVFSPRLSGYR